MHDVQRQLKQIDAFKEEWPFLLEEDREALVRGDDRCVSFDLRKIRIDREVDRGVRVQCVLSSQAEIKLHRLVHQATRIVWDRIVVRQELSGFRNS